MCTRTRWSLLFLARVADRLNKLLLLPESDDDDDDVAAAAADDDDDADAVLSPPIEFRQNKLLLVLLLLLMPSDDDDDGDDDDNDNDGDDDGSIRCLIPMMKRTNTKPNMATDANDLEPLHLCLLLLVVSCLIWWVCLANST